MRKSAPQSAKASPGGPSAFKSKVTIIAAADALSIPSRDAGGVNMLGNVVLKSGAQMHTFYATTSTIKPSFGTEGEEDSLSVLQKLEAMHPGNELSSKEFAANWIGVPAYVIVNHCDGRASEFYGTECAPMNLKPSFEADKDKTNFTFLFEQFKGTRLVPGDYSGDQSFDEPNVLAGFAIDFAKANNTQQYNIPASSGLDDVSIASTDLDHGDSVTVVGGGGSTPAVIANDDTGTEQFKLKDGASWIALKDASISFEVFKDGTTTYFIEKARN